MSNTETKRGVSTGMAVYETYDDSVETVVKPFGLALIEAARTRDGIVGLTADLAKYTDIDIFRDKYPERFFQVGMAEQNLIGVAAGLSNAGYTAFATSYCTFLTRRAYDFIAIACAEARANVKIVAALPGLTTSYGATHQGNDDLALMRAVPNLVVLDIGDATELEKAVPVVADYQGPVYMRILRGRVKRIFDPATHAFEIGRAVTLRSGDDLAIISTGIMTDRALQAAESLEQAGIDVGILHVPSVKPLDEERILDAAMQAGKVLVIENHSVIGGLGSAVTDLLCLRGVAARVKKIGVPDCFVECGSVPYVTDKYGLTVRHIVAAAKELAGG